MNDCNSMLKPTGVGSSTSSENPMRLLPKGDRLKSDQERLLKDEIGSRCKKSKADTGNSKQAEDCMDGKESI